MKSLLFLALLAGASVSNAEYAVLNNAINDQPRGGTFCEIQYELNPGERGLFECVVVVPYNRGPGLLITGNDNIDGSVVAVELSIPQPRGLCNSSGICPSWLTTIRVALSNRNTKFESGKAVFLLNGHSSP